MLIFIEHYLQNYKHSENCRERSYPVFRSRIALPAPLWLDQRWECRGLGNRIKLIQHFQRLKPSVLI